MGNTNIADCTSTPTPSYSFLKQLTPNCKLLTNQQQQQVVALERTFASEEMLKQHLSSQQSKAHTTHAHYLTPIHT